MRKAKKYLLSFILFLVLVGVSALIPNRTNAADSDFVIEDGVLTEYKGKENDIVIPIGVKEIGNRAFYDDISITSIDIPNSVTTIGYCAFSGCNRLTSINIPNSVTAIDEGAFEECYRLKNINIPNGIITINARTFEGCRNLTSINIPNSVTTIGYRAFYDCENLTNINIPDGVTSIGREAFDGTTWFDAKRKDSKNHLVIINNILIEAKEAEGDITIPDGVITIADSAFERCDKLISVHIPDSVTTIGCSAFYGCKSLTNINIPDSVTTIGCVVFEETPWFEEQGLIILNDTLIDVCKNLTSVTLPKEVIKLQICEGGDCGIFYGHTKLKELIILNPDTKIGIEDFCAPAMYNFNYNDLIIKGYKSSTAEELAKQLDGFTFNSVTFVPIDGTSSTVTTAPSISTGSVATATPQPSRTPSPIILLPATYTPVPTITPVSSPTPIPTVLPTPIVTAQPSHTPVATATPVASADVTISTVKPVNTAKPVNTQTPTAAPTAKPVSTSRPLSTIQRNKALLNEMKVSKKMSMKKGKSKKVKLSLPDDVTVVKKFSGKDGEVQVAYYTSDTGVATINKKGKIKAKKKGSVSITTVVTFENKMAKAFSTEVKVKKNKKAKSIVVKKKSKN